MRAVTRSRARRRAPASPRRPLALEHADGVARRAARAHAHRERAVGAQSGSVPTRCGTRPFGIRPDLHAGGHGRPRRGLRRGRARRSGRAVRAARAHGQGRAALAGVGRARGVQDAHGDRARRPARGRPARARPPCGRRPRAASPARPRPGAPRHCATPESASATSTRTSRATKSALTLADRRRARVHARASARRRSRCPRRIARDGAQHVRALAAITSDHVAGRRDGRAVEQHLRERRAARVARLRARRVCAPPLQRSAPRTVTSGGCSSTDRAAHAGRGRGDARAREQAAPRDTPAAAPCTRPAGIAASLTPGRAGLPAASRPGPGRARQPPSAPMPTIRARDAAEARRAGQRRATSGARRRARRARPSGGGEGVDRGTGGGAPSQRKAALVRGRAMPRPVALERVDAVRAVRCRGRRRARAPLRSAPARSCWNTSAPGGAVDPQAEATTSAAVAVESDERDRRVSPPARQRSDAGSCSTLICGCAGAVRSTRERERGPTLAVGVGVRLRVDGERVRRRRRARRGRSPRCRCRRCRRARSTPGRAASTRAPPSIA